MYNPKKVTPCFDLWGKPYYNTDQISDLVYSRMIENGSWKIVLTEGTKSGHVLKRNNDIIKLNFNGIYFIFNKIGLVEEPLYVGQSTSKNNTMDNRIGKYIKWNKGNPTTKESGSYHRDSHNSAVYLRETGISNVRYDDIYVMWVEDDFIYNLGWKNIHLKEIEKELVNKINPKGNGGYNKKKRYFYA